MTQNLQVNAPKAARNVKDDAHPVSDNPKVTTGSSHASAAVQSHKITYDTKTGGHKAESDNASANAHNPHQHADIASYKLSRDEKAAAHKHGKKGFVADIEGETRKNTDFRRVLYTGKHSQFVLMSLKPMEDIGMETHDNVDQFFRFEEGQGAVVIDGVEHAVKDGSGVIIPSGAEHNVTNTSKTDDLKLYTIYSPPNHKDKVVRKTKADALAKDEHFDGKTTE
jgi:mannose-6-phosphate isomerase-like protein (cupin superfamily)